MHIDKLCRNLTEESLKNYGIPFEMRYSAHFDHKELVNKLLVLKSEREKNSDSQDTKKTSALAKHKKSQSSCKYSKTNGKKTINLYTQRLALHKSLPKIKSDTERNLIKKAHVLKNAKTERTIKRQNLDKLFIKIKSKKLKQNK